ncbi:MAG: protein kinase [Muribaculaceae bacterium]|nr:protein kinase [Muribaculaceae bacterium]
MTTNIHNRNTENDDAPDSSGYVESLHATGISNFSEYLCDRYTNVSTLYESATGPMVLYTAVRYGKRYILKGLKESYRKDPVYNLILRKEFEIGIALEHPNIRRTLGFEDVPAIGWVIVLEYIDGMMLDHAIENGHINTSNARRIASQLAAALDYLHSRQIIHRDLKPGNILITFSGEDAKIIDMSLADSESYLILKNPAGTKRYMAPELFEPHGRPSTLSDIYSYGLIVKRLATPGNDSLLLAIADKCCAKDPAARTQSIKEIQIPDKPFSHSSKGILSLDSPRLTRMLLIIALVLSGIILILAYRRGLI